MASWEIRFRPDATEHKSCNLPTGPKTQEDCAKSSTFIVSTEHLRNMGSSLYPNCVQGPLLLPSSAMLEPTWSKRIFVARSYCKLLGFQLSKAAHASSRDSPLASTSSRGLLAISYISYLSYHPAQAVLVAKAIVEYKNVFRLAPVLGL